jgi:hypothetical protein
VLGISKHGGIDVDHDLIVLRRRAGVHALVEGSLREQCQRVGLLLLHRGRVAGRIVEARPLMKRVARRCQRLHDHCADLRCQAPAQDYRAVFLSIHMHGSTPMLACRLVGFRFAIHPSPATHEPLDVRGSAGFAERQQAFLCLRRGHASECP